jgi:outer membrane protein OmpA-like peptidoglycan-associated protein
MDNMNQKIHSISIALLVLIFFYFVFGIRAEDRMPESKNELVVYFKSTTFEIEQKSIDEILNKLDASKSYLIQGYACSNGEKTQEYLLAEAERRAEIVLNLLIKKGFPSKNLMTTSYDHSSECRVILTPIKQ